jgi:hypothetical protein
MIDCAYIGDSIAVGLEQFDSRCALYARVGADTNYIANRYSNRGGENYTVISMGSNNPSSKDNIRNAIRLRNSIRSSIVVWILPYNRTAHRDMLSVARRYGDRVIDLAPHRSSDGVHPSYGSVSNRVKQIIGR